MQSIPNESEIRVYYHKKRIELNFVLFVISLSKLSHFDSNQTINTLSNTLSNI